jgi:hypothetical protein
MEWSGGSLALHTLASKLQSFGENVIKIPEHSTMFVPDDAIMIYPEVVIGNPCNAKNVVRWLLNDPAVTIGEKTVYPESELLFTFCDYYSKRYNVLGTLSVFDLRLDTYVDKRLHVKGKTCYTIRKGYNKEHNKHLEDAILIRDYGEQQLGEELIAIFDQCETFISYDHNCFLSVHAALRGCKSVVIPDVNVSATTWRNTAGFMQYGIAYGFDDMDYAEATKHLIMPYLRRIEKENNNQVINFIDICKNKINA